MSGRRTSRSRSGSMVWTATTTTTTKGERARGTRMTAVSLWVYAATAAATALVAGAPFLVWEEKNAAQLIFGAKTATREFFSMAMWCGVASLRDAVETVLVLMRGNKAVRVRWAQRASCVNYLRIGALLFEGGYSNSHGAYVGASMNPTIRHSLLALSFLMAFTFRSALAKGVPSARMFLVPTSQAHCVMLLHWVLLVMYGLTFAFENPVRLYYFKSGTLLEHRVATFLGIHVWGCVLSITTAMASFPSDLQALYCLTNFGVEILCLVVMVYQENVLTLFQDGIVQKQFLNHLAVKFTLVIPWFYGWSSTRSRSNKI